MADTSRAGGYSRPDGYSRLSVLLHWLAAISVIALFFTHEGERGSAQYAFHLSGGALAGILLLWRVAHRVRHGLAERPAQAALLNAASSIVLWGFLATIVAVVLSGYFLPWSLGRPLDVFGWFSIPSPMSFHRGTHEFMEEVHDVSGHLFIPLLALHLLGTAKHALIDKDGVARRMFASVAGGR